MKPSKKLLIVLTLLGIAMNLSAAEVIRLDHELPYDERTNLYEAHYCIADSVSIRENPSINSELIGFVQIGASLDLVRKSDSVSVFRGIESQWYFCKIGGKKGWVWGGNIAKHGFKSTGDPDVLLLMGYQESRDGKDEYLRDVYIQIRAVRNGKELDKIVFKAAINRFQYSASSLGNKGLSDLHDIIIVTNFCGKCGCSIGNQHVFWNGKKFKKIRDAIYFGDAWASDGQRIVYPTDVGGEKGRIKFMEEEFGSNEAANDNENSKYKLVIYETTYIWNRFSLVELKPRHLFKTLMISGY